MNISKISSPENASKIAGALFIGISLYLFLFTPYLTAALGALFIGIFTPVIQHGRYVEEDTAVAGLKSGVEPLHRLIRDLDLDGNAVVVPPIRHLSESRVYIPAGTFNTLPDLYDEMTIVTGGGGRTGVSLAPPGLPLFQDAEERMEHGIAGEGIEAAREVMGHLTHGLDLASSFSVRAEEDEYRLRITQGRYREACQEIREDLEGICFQAGCPICSAYLVALVESIEEPLRIADFEVEERHVKYTLEVVR